MPAASPSTAPEPAAKGTPTPMPSRLPISAGNWKMNLTNEDADDLCHALLLPDEDAIHQIEGVQVVVAPGFLQVERVREHFAGTSVGVAGQNMHARDAGAFTGEVSPVQLAEVATWVILGHSERREFFCEDDAALNRKLAAALEHGLKPILCVGEREEERRAERTDAVLTRQITQAIDGLHLPGDFVVAYEPVWAIGSGEPASPDQAQEAVARIRALVRGIAGDQVADGARVLYGGSVKPDNIAGFVAQPDIDGALVGGAALDPTAFLAITRSIAAS